MKVDKGLLSEFVKITNDDKKYDKPINIHGTIVNKNNVNYVKMDGSEILTPFRSTIEVKENERVILNIQNHRATVTGNLSDPSSSGERVDAITQRVTDTEGKYSELKQTSDSISSKVTGLDSNYSELKQTTDSISSKVTGLDSNYSELKQTSDSISSKVTGLDSKYTELKQTSDSISSKVTGLDSKYTELKQTSDSISSKVTGLDSKYTELKQTVDGIDITGMVTFNDLSTEGKTTIHGGNIETDTLTATGEIGFADGARITPYPSHVSGAFGLSISAPGVTIGAGSWGITHTGDATFDGVLNVMPDQFPNSGIAGYASGLKVASSGNASVGKSIYANSFLSRYSTMAILSRNSVEPGIESLNAVKIGDSYKIQVADVMPLNRSIDENPYLKTDEEFGIGLDLESVVATLLSTVKKQSEEINNLKAEVFKNETN